MVATAGYYINKSSLYRSIFMCLETHNKMYSCISSPTLPPPSLWHRHLTWTTVGNIICRSNSVLASLYCPLSTQQPDKSFLSFHVILWLKTFQ